MRAPCGFPGRVRWRSSSPSASCSPSEAFILVLILFVDRIRTIGLIVTLVLMPPATYFLFAILLEVDLPLGTLWA